MQGTTLRLFVGSLLMVVAVSHVQAESLQPDPAWQQGRLDNGFEWQVLVTPQRPSDRIEVRFVINTGSLIENAEQRGYSHLLSRLALNQSGTLSSPQALLQQTIDPKRPMPPAIVSYDFTQFNLSLPNNRSDLLKETLSWMADSAGRLTITPDTVNQTLDQKDSVATWPLDTKEGWWRYRLKRSSLLGHDPSEKLTQPVDVEQLNAFYKKWYTPDAMTLIIVGNVDSRSVIEQINKAFGELNGKRDTPAPVPTLSPLSHDPVSIITSSVQQDRLSIMWDMPWQPIRDSAALERYWRVDLAREALYWHLQHNVNKKKVKDVTLGFDCRVIYQRGQCGINLDSPNDKLKANLELIARELSAVRSNGLPQDAFDALVEQKNLELQKLFMTYARTDTDILIGQRLRSQQNQVVDIAPEQYQKLRKQFLDDVTVGMINQNLRQLLSQEMTLVLVLLQPSGEPEYDMKALKVAWDNIMGLHQSSPTAATPANAPLLPEVGDIPSR